MSPETFRLIIQTMQPSKDRLYAEERLVHEMHAHHECVKSKNCECGILAAAGSFFMTVGQWTVANVRGNAYAKLLTNWVDVAVAYDRDEEIGELVFKLYATACAYRLLAT